MEEEHSTINNSNEFVPLTSSSNSHRLQIRRNILRQTTTLRSSPYNSTLSSLRRRQQQNSLIASQTINNLITNIEHNNNNIQTDVNPSLNDIETIDEHFLNTSDEENNHEDFQVLVDLSNTSPIDLIITNENNNSNESYHSLSTIDFDPEDDDDDDDDHYYHYSSSTIESIITPTNPLNIIQYPYDDDDVDNDDGGGEYSPSINNNNINDEEEEDLSIEIILESSQNNSISRRRRSIIPSNNSGLRLSDILNIPQKLYSSLYNDKYTMNTQCYICLEDFQLIDSIKILHCQHIFHTACINEWLRCHSNCAYCRTIVVIDMLRTTATRRRQRTRTRRNIIRSSTNHSIESSTFEQQQP